MGAAPQDDDADEHFNEGLHNANFLPEPGTHRVRMTALS